MRAARRPRWTSGIATRRSLFGIHGHGGGDDAAADLVAVGGDGNLADAAVARGRAPRSGSIDETRFRAASRSPIAMHRGFATLIRWYAGRTIHIHLKVHLGGSAGANAKARTCFAHGAAVPARRYHRADRKMDPYVKHSNVHRTLNNEDNIFVAGWRNPCWV